MKILFAFLIVGLPFLLVPEAIALEPGDAGTPECREVQLDMQAAVYDGDFRNHGQMVREVVHLLKSARREKEITRRCTWCIVNQFLQKTPLGEQEKCGIDSETSACCFPDGYYEDMTPEDCSDAGGISQDSGADCASVDWPQTEIETVACCMLDDSCLDVTFEECASTRGAEPQPFGSTCASTYCGSPN